ncbi:HpcH/HpaI aldolase/citrate lyase family protein [Undibacterium sp. Dicai25W]|uniref:HpcH/HpaI aldolase/citrate lyase family protein n=1 Tax=Undibacterium sp. Dicai25W TaxID=3413034 RepID=UPI003BEFA356
MHPSRALFQDQLTPVFLPVCDHYAGSEKLMRKSMALQQKLGPIFDITFDCEDGAATGDEANHAKLVCTLLNSSDNQHQRIGVRVHDINHEAFDQDLSLIIPLAAEKIAYIVLPKVSSASQVANAIEQINNYAFTAGRSHLPIHVLIETHEALADVMAIAALPQVECLSFGIMDFVSSHFGAISSTAMHSPGQFEHPLVARAKTEIAAACHRFGKVPSHSVTTEIKDLSVVENDAFRAKHEFAYTRMWSIHPDQIAPIVQTMAPQHKEICEATDILLSAQNNQWAPIQYAGKLHDRASYRYFWSILKRAKSSAITLPEMAYALLEGDSE